MIVVLNRHKAVFFLSVLIWWSFEINQQQQQQHSFVKYYRHITTGFKKPTCSKNAPVFVINSEAWWIRRFSVTAYKGRVVEEKIMGKDAKKWRKARKPSTRSVTIFIIDDLKIILLLFWIRIIPCLCIYPLDFFL